MWGKKILALCGYGNHQIVDQHQKILLSATPYIGGSNKKAIAFVRRKADQMLLLLTLDLSESLMAICRQDPNELAVILSKFEVDYDVIASSLTGVRVSVNKRRQLVAFGIGNYPIVKFWNCVIAGETELFEYQDELYNLQRVERTKWNNDAPVSESERQSHYDIARVALDEIHKHRKR